MVLKLSRGLLHQYIAGLAACLSIVASGSVFGWITPLISRLLGPDSQIPMTSAQSNWVISIMEIGALLGPVPAGFLANRIGRKPVILATGPLYILTWLAVLRWPTAISLAIARICQGFIMGLPFTAGPVYLGEIASNSTRGAISSLFFNSWWVGFIISYAVGPMLSFTAFTWFTLALNVPFILLFFWQPETPYYYVMVGKFEAAEQSLRWFRGPSPTKLKDELEEIKKSVEEDKKKSTGVRDLVATKEDRKALTLLMVISAVRISSGTGSLLVYATQVFDETPNLSISPDLITVSLGVTMLVGGLFSAVTSDVFGRRFLLLFSSVGCLLCTTSVGTYYYLLTIPSISSEAARFSWIAPVLILAYAGFCSTGLYPVCVSYTAELFTSSTRGSASSLSSTNVVVFSFISMVLFQPINDTWGLHANFYFYSITTFMGCVYFFISAPETKGRSFTQIRNELCQKPSKQSVSPENVITHL